MRLKYLAPAIVSCALLSQHTCAADCAASGRVLQFSHMDPAVSLSSPDREWDFISIGPTDPGRDAKLHIFNRDAKRRWNIGSLGRNGTAFWSDDSRHLFLRDEFAAEDTRIRVFDLTGLEPTEITELDQTVRKIVVRHLMADESILRIHYPQVCFASVDTSEILLTIDAPRVPKWGNGKGRDMAIHLAVHLPTLPSHELRVDTEW